jgi:5'-nucleotidase
MDDSEGTDFHAAQLGHVVVTPLKVDLTDHANLDRWADTLNCLVKQVTP